MTDEPIEFDTAKLPTAGRELLALYQHLYQQQNDEFEPLEADCGS